MWKIINCNCVIVGWRNCQDQPFGTLQYESYCVKSFFPEFHGVNLDMSWPFTTTKKKKMPFFVMEKTRISSSGAKIFSSEKNSEKLNRIKMCFLIS